MFMKTPHRPTSLKFFRLSSHNRGDKAVDKQNKWKWGKSGHIFGSRE